MTVQEANADQRRFWSDEVGAVWVRQGAAMDSALAPVLTGVLDRAGLRPGQTVLDIGCGAGTSTRDIARRVAPGGTVTGVDISAPLLAQANARGDGITYLNADAQTHRFPPADRIVSRFGVMFFADTAAAFANMGDALAPEGRIVFATWGDIGENPFFTLPASVARKLLGPVPKSDPDAPGPFALREPHVVLGYFAQAGLHATVETVTETLALGDSPREIALTMAEIGPIAGALRHHAADADQRSAVIDALIETLDSHRTNGVVTLPAQIHYFTARKPA